MSEDIDDCIIVGAGPAGLTAAIYLARYHLDMVIHDDYQYHWLANTPNISPIRIWLKVNTDMNRLGIMPHQVFSMTQKLRSLPTVKSIVMMSHLANANQENVTKIQKQHKNISFLGPWIQL